jgi:signal transduction histidine kinase
VLHQDGNSIPVEINRSVITLPDKRRLVIGIFRDIRERILFQERNQQAEKMQAVGQLAGGIAHDFNNQLTGVLGYADLLMQRLDDPLLRRFAESIKVAATRSADLTRQLLAFSRKGKYLSVPTDLHKVIVEVVELLRRSIDKRIAIQLHLDANPTSVLGDPTQLQNALLNLGLNARDAMPEGGMIQFSTRVLLLPSGGPEDLPAGRYIQTSVIDTGCGMDETVRRRLFEPFFTTKEVGKGTGLGLASVYGTVRNHGGNIQVESTPKKGSAFHLLLPLATETESPCSTTSQVVGPILAQHRILIVDDEPLLLGLLQTMLEGMGAQVTIQSDPVVALEHYRQHWQDFDLVILDMVMPGLGGKDLFAAMKAANPNILALLASGYSLGSEAQAILDAGVRGFIQKPFDQAQLAEAIQRVL